MAWQVVQTIFLSDSWLTTSQLLSEEIIRISSKHTRGKKTGKALISQAFPGQPLQIWGVRNLYLSPEKQIFKMATFPEITALRAIAIKGFDHPIYNYNGWKITIDKWIE